MFVIKEKRILGKNLCQFRVQAPYIAKKRKPGQFIILRLHEKGERFPLTISDANPEEGDIWFIALGIGKSTQELNALKEGDKILDIVGPLGKPTPVKNHGNVACIGGGVGIALLYPLVKAYKSAGNKIISILGARTKDLLILEDEIKKHSDDIFITTDDGSYGEKGFVTDALRELVEKRGKNLDFVMAVGPVLMMKAVAEYTKSKNIETMVSLNPIMVDGTGMCGACRVIVGGKTLFGCVDGPEFDAHEVDFDNLLQRLSAYRKMEEESLNLFLKSTRVVETRQKNIE